MLKVKKDITRDNGNGGVVVVAQAGEFVQGQITHDRNPDADWAYATIKVGDVSMYVSREQADVLIDINRLKKFMEMSGLIPDMFSKFHLDFGFNGYEKPVFDLVFQLYKEYEAKLH